MKTLAIYAALFLIPLIGFCQSSQTSAQTTSQTSKPIDGFLGIKFGATLEAVKSAIIAKGGVLDKTNSNAERLVFSNVKLGHRPAVLFTAKFINNKVYEASFLFQVDIETKTIDYYNSLNSDIADVYGQGKIFRNFKLPYVEGDGFEVAALKSGHADFNSSWISGTNIINSYISNTLNISYPSSSLLIGLVYQDGEMIDQLVTKQKAKEKADF